MDESYHRFKEKSKGAMNKKTGNVQSRGDRGKIRTREKQ
jgi:hypothetical protein